MKKRINLTVIILSTLICTFYLGCGEDTTPTNTGTSSGYPNINIKVGSMYQFTNDSVTTSGSTRTRIVTRDSVLSKGTYYGYSNSWMILSVSKDTVINLLIERDTLYLSYDSAGGKFYQYNIARLINPNLTPGWNLVANFSVSQGTQWSIASFDTTINGIPGHCDIKGKVAENTTIQTTAQPPSTITCYRIEISAAITTSGVPVTTIYIDYYIGYSPPGQPTNPSGPVRINLRPFSIFGFPFAGFDQILQTTSIP